MNLKVKILHYYEKYMIGMGAAGHLIFVFQAHKIWVNKSAEGVSLEGFLIAFLSIVSWLLYGFLKKDKVLVCVNIFGFFVSMICLAAIIFLQ